MTVYSAKVSQENQVALERGQDKQAENKMASEGAECLAWRNMKTNGIIYTFSAEARSGCS